MAENLSAALDREVTHIYTEGFDEPLDPERLPALTELAEAAIESPESQTVAVWLLLRGCCADSMPSLIPMIRRNHRQVSEQDAKRALLELFGLTRDPDPTLTGRSNRAGPLLGYPTGYSVLRKVKRTIEGKEVNLTRLFCRQLVAQLVAVATEKDFHYTRKYVPTTKWAFLPDDYADLPLYLSCLESMYLHAAPKEVRGLASYIEALPDKTLDRPNLSPVAVAICDEFPELRTIGVDALSEASAIFLVEMIDLYESGFNPHAFRNFEVLAYGDHPAGGLPDWYRCVPYIPDQEYFSQDGEIDEREVDQREWMLLWITYHCKGSLNYQNGVAELLGLLPPFRGKPRRHREEYASANLGFDGGEQLRASGLPLSVLYEFVYALTRFAVEIELHADIHHSPPHRFKVPSRPFPKPPEPLPDRSAGVTVSFSSK
jgi:hypothetical protein